MGFSRLPNDFELAPGYTVAAWRKLTLDENDPGSKDWPKAVRILKARFNGRFFNPGNALISAEQGEKRGKFGFAILAIDFLVIESLQGFKEGHPNHQGRSETLFKTFLENWPEFVNCLPAGASATVLARQVYLQGRCALHHTGSTDKLLVRRTGKRIFVFHADGRIEINRTLLHRKLGLAMRAYANALVQPGEIALRVAFKNKMTHIAGN